MNKNSTFQILAIATALSFVSFSVNAQVQDSFVPGLILTDPLLNNLVRDNSSSRTWYCNFPTAASVKKYTNPPVMPFNQGTQPYCAVYAVAGWISIENIRKNKPPLLPETLLEWVIKARRNPQLLGDVLQTAIDKGYVNEKSWSKVFEKPFNIKNPRGDAKKMLQEAIFNEHPILIRLECSPVEASMRKSGVDCDPVPHAMVVVGYTLTEAIIMNSRGRFWDEGGFIKMPFATLLDKAMEGIVLGLDGKSSYQDSLFTATLQGGASLQVKSADKWETVELSLDSTSQSFAPADKVEWDTKTEFQLQITIPENDCIYFLNFDGKEFRRLESYEIELASNKQYPFHLDTLNERLILLYSNSSIKIATLVDDLNKMQGTIKGGTVEECLKKGLGTWEVPLDQIQWASDGSKFKTSNAMNRGDKSVVAMTVRLFNRD